MGDKNYCKQHHEEWYESGKPCNFCELEAENKALRELVERTCGDGCHCAKENNGICAMLELDALEKGDD
jgi:hypothetical protein